MKKILFKKLHSDAKVPQVSREGDAAYDVYSYEDIVIAAKQRNAVNCGVASAFSSDYVALVWDRGGMAVKNGVTTIAGVIDSNYRGEWIIAMFNTTDQDYEIKKGDRIAQVVLQKVFFPETEIVEELPESIRGDQKYGSSGK